MKTATLGQVRKILELLDGVPQEQVQALLASGLLADLFKANVDKVDREEFRRICGIVHRHSFKVCVDYSWTLIQMVAVGKYDWVNSNITQDRFPVQGSGRQEVEVVLFHFNRVISSDDVIAELDKVGYRPANPAELLALGASQPELQRNFPIVALGSSWREADGARNVLYLCRSVAGRVLRLFYFGDGWFEDCRFAAVRK